MIFDITYTPYKPRKDFTAKQLAEWQDNRTFYNMTGNKNIYKYMVKEEKQMQNSLTGFTMLDYFQKSTGVFDETGMISKEQLTKMQDRARNNQGNFWHGFISFNKEDSVKIDHVEKCFDLLQKTFPTFLKEAGFDRENIDLMCGLHLDKSSHFHIHYCFWEKQATIKNPRAKGYIYRKKGKIPMPIIARMTERLNAYTLNDNVGKYRDEALKKMRGDVYLNMLFRDTVREKILSLADKLPKDKPLWYSSKEMEPYREEIDFIVDNIISTNPEFAKKNFAFQKELRQRENNLREKMETFYSRYERLERYNDERDGDKTKVHKIESIERLKYDYKRRLGNIVLSKVRYVQNNKFTYDKRKKYKSNSKYLKRNIAMSDRKVGKMIDRFFTSFASMFEVERTSHKNRLQEIEEEITAAYETEQACIAKEETKRKANEQAEEQTVSVKENQNYNSR